MVKGAEPRTGTFLGIPYDWHRPTRSRFRQRTWNPDDRRILTPRAFGWGYDLNVSWLFHWRKRRG